MERSAVVVINRCKDLKTYWGSRDAKMRQWYRLVQQVDELKTEKMESFVGNDARAMYNLALHVLNVKVPYRLKQFDMENPDESEANEKVAELLDKAWEDVNSRYRHGGPHQNIHRTIIGYMLSTGWYSVFAPTYDDGSKVYAEPWNPIDTYPMWDLSMGMTEVAHIYKDSSTSLNKLSTKNKWASSWTSDQTVYDYWWTESDNFNIIVWNAIVVGSDLVKFEPTRFSKIPVYIAPIGGLPDTGSLSEGSSLSTSSYNASGTSAGDRWKEEIGQSIVATNENIYRTWNKWWTFSLQLLRDTAQPRVFERSRSGKPIVKPEEVFRRGVVWRGGPEDSVEFITPPNMPMELRSNQLDLEAMMQRGGVSWAMFGAVQGQMSAYVMSQISASANQVLSSFHEAREYLYADIANDWLQDILSRGTHPYNFKRPDGIKGDAEVDATFPIEIPGDMVQRLTAARMADPEFRLSYSYTMNKLFPDIKDPARERARVLSDQAMLNPVNSIIAQVRFYRQQADYLTQSNDPKTAELYNLAADSALAQLKGSNPAQNTSSASANLTTRTEAQPPSMTNNVGGQV